MCEMMLLLGGLLQRSCEGDRRERMAAGCRLLLPKTRLQLPVPKSGDSEQRQAPGYDTLSWPPQAPCPPGHSSTQKHTHN